MQTCNPVKVAQKVLAEKLKTARLAVDATAGNGNDTLFMARHTPHDAVILAFDIQEQAIQAVKKLLLEENLLEKVKLYCTSHTNIPSYVEKNLDIDVAMFNLGYLPGKDHSIVTECRSTMTAVQMVIERLHSGGILSIVTYPGHLEGQQEEQQLYEYCMELSAKDFTVLRAEMMNHSKNPPILYLIEKVKKR